VRVTFAESVRRSVSGLAARPAPPEVSVAVKLAVPPSGTVSVGGRSPSAAAALATFAVVAAAADAPPTSLIVTPTVNVPAAA